MKYAIVEDDTGNILQTGNCSPSQFSVKGWDGVTAIECTNDVADDTHEYVNGEFVLLPGPTDAEINEKVLKEVRLERTLLLQDCDWTQATDSPLSTSDKTAWADYRQLLRAITDNIGSDVLSIDDVVFPTPPA